LLEAYPNTKAVITADVGVAAHEAIDYAQLKGLKVFVTDHHTVGVLPQAEVVVDPNRPDDPYELKGICGAYVMQQCLSYYADRYEDFFAKEQINRLCVFAGIGTVSDSMPLYQQNRILVRDALSICRYIYSNGDSDLVDNLPGCLTYKKAFYGLYLILDLFVSLGKIGDMAGLNEEVFGFYLAPMFNAVNRMEGNMDDAFGVFFGHEPEASLQQLYDLNEQRRLTVEEFYEKLDQDPQPFAPYVCFTEAHKGILGLLAQRKLRRYVSYPEKMSRSIFLLTLRQKT
jgi:single-stranded-DNA-specific exonuclease